MSAVLHSAGRAPTTRTRGASPAAVTAILGGACVALLVMRLGPLGAALVVAAVASIWLLRDPFRLFLALIVAWPIATLYVGIAAPSGIPDLRFERILILLLLLTLIYQFLTANRQLPGLAAVVGVFLAVRVVHYLFGALTSEIVEPDPLTLVNATLVPVVLYWLTKVFITSTRQLRALVTSLVVGSVLIALTGFYERAVNAEQSPFNVTTGTASGSRYLGVPGGRAAGVVGNPAVYGAILGIGLLATICLALNSENRRMRFISASAAVLLGYGVVVSFTRSAWVAVVAAVLVAPVFMKGLVWKAAKFAVVGLVVLSVTLPRFIDDFATNEVVQGRLLESENTSGRIERATFSIQKFLERPITGWGDSALDELIAREFTAEGQGFSTSHNTYLTLLVDGGLVVALSFLAVLIFWGRQAIRGFGLQPRGSFESSAIGVMVGTGLIFLISGMFLELKFFPYFSALFWMAGATLENLASPNYRLGGSSDQISDEDRQPSERAADT